MTRITWNTVDVTPLRAVALAIVISFMAFAPLAAQDFDKGFDAYSAGDYQTALREWRPLAEQGDADAQLGMALMYDSGEGVPQDDAEAVRWYRLAAEQGHASAQISLGLNYQLGVGVLQDNVMAHMWYNIASANGQSKAGERRDERAGQMTNADISKAQQMARDCMSSNYQNCGG